MSFRRSHLALAVVALCLLALPVGRAASATRAQLTVYAAASLTDVFPAIDKSEKYSFGGSNTLAAQITQGAPADVFASANMTLPTTLFQKGLCSKPVVFTRNTLVIVVPKSNPADIDFAYPKGSFHSESAILKLAGRLERVLVGAYLGAAENVETPGLRLPIGQIAANEAQHVGALEALEGRSPIGKPFAPALQIGAVSDALDEYES